MESTHNCRRCGRELKDEESIRLGIGPICLQKEKEKLPVRHGLDLWDDVWHRLIEHGDAGNLASALTGEFIGE